MGKWQVVVKAVEACFPVGRRGFAAGVRKGNLLPAEVKRLLSPSVAVFWDLDNKPPKCVQPYDAALRLKDVAAAFGQVVDTVAYANHHAFSHVPGWVREERQERKKLDMLEKLGIVKPEQPYICGVCGAKKKTHVDLKKHFKSLHEREQKKRINRLNSLKGSKRVKFQVSIEEKSAKFRNAARQVIVPKVGYGLAAELRRAGVFVRTVPDEPQAADMALKRHMLRSIKQGVNCICLVSDDSDFSDTLRTAQQHDLHTVVVGETKVLRKCADLWFSWQDVTSGQALAAATETHGQWMSDAATLGEVFDLADHNEMDGSFVSPSRFGGLYDSEDDIADDEISDNENPRNHQRPDQNPFVMLESGSSDDESN